MKAVVFRGVEEVEVVEVPDPAVEGPGDAIVEISVAGLCGSDLHPYFGRETGLDAGTILGHEFVGRVVETGAAVRLFAPGDRVVAPFTTSCGACPPCTAGLTARCDRGRLFGWVQEGVGLHGAQARYIQVPLADSTLVPVPPDLSDDAVALLAGDILATALFGTESARVSEGSVVAVVGCGPVGLVAIRAALHRGAAAVVAVDRVASRLDLARRFGATPAALADDPRRVVAALSDGRGADGVVEAVGSPEATRTAADLLRVGGTLAAVGVHTEPHLALSPGEIYDRNLTYAAGRCPARRLLPEALELALADAALLETMITHRLALDDAPRAYRAFGERREGWGKVVFEPGR